MNTSAPDRKRRSRLTLVLLALLFVAPVFVAWWLQSSSHWRPGYTVNHGTLVIPPRPLDIDYPLMAPDRSSLKADYLRGKWTLIYIGRSDCTRSCADNLYKMRQARLAQGENMNRVQRLFLATGNDDPLPQVLSEYAGMDVAVLPGEDRPDFLSPFVIDGAHPGETDRIYLVDPLGNLMMYYSPDAETRGILKDLQRVLKASSIG